MMSYEERENELRIFFFPWEEKTKGRYESSLQNPWRMSNKKKRSRPVFHFPVQARQASVRPALICTPILTGSWTQWPKQFLPVYYSKDLQFKFLAMML